jgi:hypothetical protein
MLVLDSELDSINTKYAWESEIPSGLLADFEESILAWSLKAQAKIKLVCEAHPFLSVVFSMHHCSVHSNCEIS